MDHDAGQAMGMDQSRVPSRELMKSTATKLALAALLCAAVSICVAARTPSPTPDSVRVRIRVSIEAPDTMRMPTFVGIRGSLRRASSVDLVTDNEDVAVHCVLIWEPEGKSHLVCWAEERVRLVEAAKPMLTDQQYQRWSADRFGRHLFSDGQPVIVKRSFEGPDEIKGAADWVVERLEEQLLPAVRKRLSDAQISEVK